MEFTSSSCRHATQWKTGRLSLSYIAATLLLLSSGDVVRGGEFAVLAEGTLVSARTTEDVDPSSLNEGDTLPLAVAEEVKREEYTLISAGSPVKATIATITRGGKDTKFLKVVSTEAIDGQEVMLRGRPEKPEGDTPVIVDLPIPPSLPAGTTFILYLADSYYVEE